MWDPEMLDLEVRAMFFPLSGGYLIFRMLEWVHRGEQMSRAEWHAHGLWYAKTTKGKALTRAQAERRKATIVAVRACTQCGSTFGANAHRPDKRLCSMACVRRASVAARKLRAGVSP